MNRREFLRHLALASILAGVGVTGVVELSSKLVSENQEIPTLPTIVPATSSTTQTGSQTQSGTQSVPNGYVFVAPMNGLSGKSYAYFNHPKSGLSILINYSGAWMAFSAVCTHAGCNVSFTGSALYCPCHNGYFSASNGSVQSGPPPTKLAEYGVKIVNGNLYVSESSVN